jgi:7SK snRNA methylphosphate capping enzyme
MVKSKTGSYASYYNFRPNSNIIPHSPSCKTILPDDRLVYLQGVDGKSVLDIGCNSGILTIALASILNARKVVGIDIDDDLLRKAKNNLFNVASSAGPYNKKSLLSDASLFERRSLSKLSPCNHSNLNYFPKSFMHTFGTIPVIFEGAEEFPGNVNFLKIDIIKDSLIPETFDYICAFSVTKWIHINYGDAGIDSLFALAFKLLNPGGKLIIEVQPWLGYDQHCKNLDNLHYRPLEGTDGRKTFWDLILEHGFINGQVMKEGKEGKGFESRPIWSFEKPF